MTKADIYRQKLIHGIINEGKKTNNRLNVNLNGKTGLYTEVITLDEIEAVTDNFTTHPNVESFLNDFIYDRLNEVIGGFGYVVNESAVDVNSTDLYDGYEVNVPLKRKPYASVDELFSEIDQELGNTPQPAPQPNVNPQLVNKASDIPITKEPGQVNTPNLPTVAKKEKTQNPRKVDFILKSVFESKFNNYEMKTDVGKWKAIKTLKKDGKLSITWESIKEPSIFIETIIFPKDTNKVIVEVKNRGGEMLLETFFEIYRIPTDEFLAEKFFRKTLFSLLKKYVDTNVIQIDPFNREFVFWKTDNPNFSYSFSTPNKNKIILDLISFISTAQKPILDDFFEQNNLKHKQGYLQTLLDSAEAAGLFRFKREGNEILILRGKNYKAFLEGKVRRVIF
jgi:hypothetical protein